MNRSLRAPGHRDPQPIYNLIPLAIPLGCLLLLVLTVLPASTEEVSWELFQNQTNNCYLPQGYQIACGDYGVFVVDPVEPVPTPISTRCSTNGSGEEDPPGFTQRKAFVHEGMGIQTPTILITLSGGVSLTPNAPESGSYQALVGAGKRSDFKAGLADPDLPCALGSCFADKRSPLHHPWIAVLDWDDWHGWTVGWTASIMANHEIPVAHYSFDELDEDELGEGTTDLHLLALACQVAEDVDKRGFDAPLVMNMSFGRPPAPTDDASTTTCEYLNCQIGRVFDHLEAATGPATPAPILVAAAGNHREVLSPAAHDNVLATGMMDLAEFNALGQLSRAWEMAENSKIDPLHLMVGSFLCLNYWVNDEERTWEAPAGSSYAAAALTGWLARQQLLDPLADPAAAALEPIWAPTPSGDRSVFLSQAGQQLIQYPHAARGLLARAFGVSSAPCGRKLEREPSVLVVSRRQLPTSTESLGSSIIESQEANRPTPEPDPCIPCAALGDGGYFSKGAIAGLVGARFKKGLVGAGPGPTPGPSPIPNPIPIDTPVYIDLSARSDLPARQTITGIALRLGDELYDLGLEQTELDGFNDGHYTHLKLNGFNHLFCSDEQPSLVYTVVVGTDPEELWSSTPITILGDSWSLCGNPE